MRKLIALSVLFFVSAAFPLELSVNVLTSQVEYGEDLEIRVRLESFDPVNVTLTYSLQNEDGIIHEELEKKSDVKSSVNFNKEFGLENPRPGYYNITVTAETASEDVNRTSTFRVVRDCVEFTGLNNIYAVYGKGQECVFTLNNKCPFEIRNVQVTLLNANASVNNVTKNATVRLQNVLSPKKSKKEILRAVYDEGSSQKSIDFEIKTQGEMNDFLEGLFESSELLVNNSKANLAVVVLGDKQEMADYHNAGVEFVNQAVNELELENYALSVNHFIDAIQSLRAANNLSSTSLTNQVVIIIVVCCVVVGIILLLVYNKYRHALKMKQLGELGKS